MKTWTFFQADGTPTGMSFSGAEEQLAANTPHGHVAVEGMHDHLSRRYDPETDAVVAYKPPAPVDTDLCVWSWDSTSERWVSSPTLLALAHGVLTKVNLGFDEAVSVLTADYPQAEMLTWGDQQKEALAYQADTSVATPFLDALAAARGIPREALIAKTLAKVLQFRAASAALIGRRQRLVDQIKASTSAEELALISW